MKTVLNFKKDDVALSVPTSAIVAPGLAGWCWRECIWRTGTTGGMAGRENERPRPKCRQCPELYRAGPRSWRSSSTCARAVMVCVRPAGEDGGAFAALFEAEWLQGRKVQQNTGTQLLLKILRERKKADGAVKRGRGLADGMAKREDGRPSPEGWQRPGPCRAGLCSWRSSSTSALLPAVLEEDRAGAPGRVHLGYPCSPDGVREDHVAGTGAWGPHGRGAAGGASRTLSGASEAAFQPELVPEGPLPGVELWMRVVRGDDAGGGGGCAVGWRTFFEVHVWRSTMEV